MFKTKTEENKAMRQEVDRRQKEKQKLEEEQKMIQGLAVLPRITLSTKIPTPTYSLTHPNNTLTTIDQKATTITAFITSTTEKVSTPIFSKFFNLNLKY